VVIAASVRRSVVRSVAPALVAVAGITAARLAYQAWLSPYELVADEAQYWDWSRHLSASYYSKGPGVAWLIALSTHLIGTSVFSIRASAALCMGVASVMVALLAVEWAPDERTARRAAIGGVVLVTLLPVYQLTALLMTIDAPYYACCAVAMWAAWRAWVAERDRQPSTAAWVGTALAVGIGFLFKYTALLLVPGFVWFAMLERGRVRWSTARRRIAYAVLTLGVTVAPVVAWNVAHGAAALGHLLTYVNVPGGDRPFVATSYRPVWTMSFIAAQLAIVGPAMGAMGRAVAASRRDRVDVVRFALCGAAPSLCFIGVTFRAPAEANWPASAYLFLLPLSACTVLARSGGAWRWWAAIGVYGVASALAIHAPFVVARAPLVGRFVPVHRFTGTAAAASRLGPAIDMATRQSSRRPIIVATSHNAAGLLAFYLPGRPTVASAGHYFGDRLSSYDYFPDTNLSSDLARGGPAVLIGGTPHEWRRAFTVDSVTPISVNPPAFIVGRFDGPRPPPSGDLR
jgi:4-amino-4-deoxy-L-arabinose transferase-like glycosyltransferase